MNIELYIGDRLCDIGNPENLGIYLKRVFIKPSELSVKDAQKSYEISLPATATNNEIFNYTNVEEVQGKFKVYDKARLYIDGILILDGKFRMSQITRDAYIGNLGVPAAITVKDVFGDINMNQTGTWLKDFANVTDITTYNTAANSPVIFPLALYSLLQKRNIDGNFSMKNVYDNSVVFGLDDIPPSINVIQLLQKIFENAKYTLTGSAVNDERIRNLYVSYKNPDDYQPQYGLGPMEVLGVWGNYRSDIVEKNFTKNRIGDRYSIIASNIFNATNSDTIITDTGANILKTQSGNTKNIRFKIPNSGLYKITFNANIRLKPEPYKNPIGMHITTKTFDETGSNFELKLVRYSDRDKFNNEKYDNTFFKNNQDQESDVDGSIYPQPGAVNFIDPLQNSDFICGFAWGKPSLNDLINPAAPTRYNNPMAISGGRSWSFALPDGTQNRYFSAINSPGYVSRSGSSLPNADKFEVNLQNAPTGTNMVDNKSANGVISQVVWLEKGEMLDIVSVSTLDIVSMPPLVSLSRWINHEIYFSLSVVPFTPYKNWLKVDIDGAGTASMDFNNPAVFNLEKMDLINFLPSNIKVNDWIDNFCKAFNLRLENTSDKVFELNIKSTEVISRLSNIIDLDKKASVMRRTNQSLGLPYLYDLGFTIDNSEEGYVRSMKIDKNTEERILNSGITGGGQFYTGSCEKDVISQRSSFSYCWYKNLYANDNDAKNETNPILSVPVITDSEVWENDYDYDEMRSKRYFDKAQRFWYKDSLFDAKINDQTDVKLALVKNSYSGAKSIILDYENKQRSILRNFFLLLTNDKDYTFIDCYLSPEEYASLPVSLIKFNGDLYHTAEIDGYGPTGRNAGTLKLIKRIV
ncbi:hypothetical protein [Dysgonomonas sp.]